MCCTEADVFSLQKQMGHADLQVLRRYLAQPISSMGLPYFGNPIESLCDDCDPLVLDGMLAYKQFVASRYELSYSIWDWVVYEHIR
jgi:hypothetical protein